MDAARGVREVEKEGLNVVQVDTFVGSIIDGCLSLARAVMTETYLSWNEQAGRHPRSSEH